MSDRVTPPVNDPRAAQRASLRRAVLHLVGAVVVLDGIALAVYYLGGVQQASPRTQTIFTVSWTVTTAMAVAFLLRRVRLARMAGRPSRRTR